MKRNKTVLIAFIAMEAMVTGITLFQGNFVAAAGWGFLMFTNMSILTEFIEKQNNGKSN